MHNNSLLGRPPRPHIPRSHQCRSSLIPPPLPLSFSVHSVSSLLLAFPFPIFVVVVVVPKCMRIRVNSFGYCTARLASLYPLLIFGRSAWGVMFGRVAKLRAARNRNRGQISIPFAPRVTSEAPRTYPLPSCVVFHRRHWRPDVITMTNEQPHHVYHFILKERARWRRCVLSTNDLSLTCKRAEKRNGFKLL